MKEVPQIEAIKYALRQSKDGIVVSFVIHPNDLDPALQCLPIGARVMFGWYEIADDEKPAASVVTTKTSRVLSASEPPQAPKPKRKFSDLPFPQQAGIRSEDALFQAYLANVEPEAWAYFSQIDPKVRLTTSDRAAYVIRKICGVGSRAELGTDDAGGFIDPQGAEEWRKLNAGFEAWALSQKYADVLR